jgi:hypothetical protein
MAIALVATYRYKATQERPAPRQPQATKAASPPPRPAPAPEPTPESPAERAAEYSHEGLVRAGVYAQTGNAVRRARAEVDAYREAIEAEKNGLIPQGTAGLFGELLVRARRGLDGPARDDLNAHRYFESAYRYFESFKALTGEVNRLPSRYTRRPAYDDADSLLGADMRTILASMGRSGKVNETALARLSGIFHKLRELRAARGKGPSTGDEVRLVQVLNDTVELANLDHTVRKILDERREQGIKAEYADFGQPGHPANTEEFVEAFNKNHECVCFVAMRAWLSASPALRKALKGANYKAFVGAERDAEGRMKDPRGFLDNVKNRNPTLRKPLSTELLEELAKTVAGPANLASADQRIDEYCPWVKPRL